MSKIMLGHAIASVAEELDKVDLLWETCTSSREKTELYLTKEFLSDVIARLFEMAGEGGRYVLQKVDLEGIMEEVRREQEHV